MSHYTPPLRDMQFVMHEVLNVVAELKQIPAHADIDADTINAVIEEGGKFASQVAYPLNRSGRTRRLQRGLCEVRGRRLAIPQLRPGLRRPGLAAHREPSAV
jgi:Acyl-CoA dehydrogenase N terminal